MIHWRCEKKETERREGERGKREKEAVVVVVVVVVDTLVTEVFSQLTRGNRQQPSARDQGQKVHQWLVSTSG